jgi:hypothetical protein
MKLLTRANPKVTRGEASGYLTAILHLAPANLSGHEVCGSRTKGCSAVCLNSAGRGGIGATFDASGGLVVSNAIQRARIARTQFLFAAHDAFVSQLHGEIAAHVRKAQRLGLKLAVRLNGTSDLPVEMWGVIQVWESVQFYDYTKRFDPASKSRPSCPGSS